MVTRPSAQRIVRIRRDSEADQLALRQSAFDAALAIYREHGLAGLTMRAVADSVGVSPMALYRYFTNKAELLRALGEVALGELLDVSRATVEGLAGAQARLLASTRAFIAYWEANPEHYRLVYFEAVGSASLLNAPRLAESGVYRQILEFSNAQFIALADELGGERSRVPLARDLRLTMMMGYLQASMVNTRYPWHDKAALREGVINAAVQAAARCLLGQ